MTVLPNVNERVVDQIREFYIICSYQKLDSQVKKKERSVWWEKGWQRILESDVAGRKTYR